MELNIISIGNSKGLRIPKTILKQCAITNKVNLNIQKNKIIITPIKHNIRQNWNKLFQNMHKKNDDTLIINDNLDLDKGWNK